MTRTEEARDEGVNLPVEKGAKLNDTSLESMSTRLLELEGQFSGLNEKMKKQGPRASKIQVSNVESRLAEIEMLLGLSSARNRLSNWRKIESNQIVLDTELPDEAAPFLLPKDIYSIVATSNLNSNFWIALLVIIGFQVSLLALLLLDQVGIEDGNVLGTPANVEEPVRAAQVLALIIASFSQSDLRQGIEGISEGLPSIYQGEDRFKDMGPIKWYFAYFIRFLQGLVNLFASFVLLVQAETVFDVLLNFLGVQFISDLDDLAFSLGGKGYFGSSVQKIVHDIMQARFLRVSEHNKCRTYAHVFGIFTVLVCLVGIFWNLAVKQDQGVFAIEAVTAEFGDEVIPFLGLFNGCYQPRQDGQNLNRRLVYEQVGAKVGGGKFGYCDELEDGSSEGWVFFDGDSIEDACEKYILRSDQTNTFDLLDAAATQWYTKDGQLIDYLQVSQIQKDSLTGECGFDILEKTFNSCDLLDMPTRFDIAGTSSLIFEKLAVPSTQLDASLDATRSHPIYLSTSNSEIIIFTGRRWVLTTAEQISEHLSGFRQDSGWNHSAVNDYLYNQGNLAVQRINQPTPWVMAISDIVDTTTDPGTPLALQWYNVRDESTLNRSFPFADLTRPQEVSLGCARCDDDSIRCENGGVCVDGVCECQNRATGVLCRDAPLGDGICDDFFNTADFEYDGGDCCASTCNGALCGGGGLSVAFGADLRDNTYVSQYLRDKVVIGFENCKDPEMEIFTIELVPIEEVYDGILFGEDCGLEAVNVVCDGVLYLQTPNLYMAESVDEVEKCHEDGPLVQQIRIPAGVSCELSRPLDDFEHFFELALFRGNTTDSEKNLILEADNRTSTLTWSVPTRCLQRVFTKYLGSGVNRIDDITSKVGVAVQQMASDGISAFLCTLDEELVMERYALTMFNVSVGIQSNTWQEHVCYGWGSGRSGMDIICNDDDKVVEIEGENMSGMAGGTIPSELFLLSHLSRINLDSNEEDLFGTLPTEIGNLHSSLTSLSLRDNRMNSTIPTEIGRLTKLEYLNLAEMSHNNFAYPPASLFGSIPSEIGRLTAITHLELRANSDLSGTIPTEIGLLANLKRLDLSDCLLSGSIPTEIGLLDNLEYLNLESNALNGTIPSEIGLLTNLGELHLGRNGLGGTVPQEIFELQNLETLDLVGLLLRDPDFSCDETYIEVIVTTGWGCNECTSWEIVGDDLTISVASGGDYRVDGAAHLEQICAPANACTFVLYDTFGDTGASVMIKRLEKVYEINEDATVVELDICS